MKLLKTPTKQSQAAKLAMRHPYLVAVFAALALAGWTAVLYGDWREVVGAGVIMFVITALLWRPGGQRGGGRNGYFRRSTTPTDVPAGSSNGLARKVPIRDGFGPGTARPLGLVEEAVGPEERLSAVCAHG